LIYRPGITCSKCSKCSILLTCLSHRCEMTADLLAPAAQAGSDKLMAALMRSTCERDAALCGWAGCQSIRGEA